MRNILEYPITDKERIETLEQIKNDILAEETVGDLRAEILQECIDTIKSNHTKIELGADELALEKINELENWYQQQKHRARENVLSHLKMTGVEPGIWEEWASKNVTTPPPLTTAKNGFDLVVCAVHDALTQDGVAAWDAYSASCIAQMIHVQLSSRKRLLAVLERIASSPYADINDLCQIAEDAIFDEKPNE